MDDEKREISNLICSFLNKMQSFQKDKIDQYLNFFSEARANFTNLDNVVALLVHVNILQTSIKPFFFRLLNAFVNNLESKQLGDGNSKNS